MKFSASTLAAFLGLSLHTFAADVSGGGAKGGELKVAPRAPLYPPKDTPAAVAQNFAKAKIPQGFTGDVWAAEPLLANPVAFCFDGRGRMFIAETHRYRTSVLDIRHYYWMIEDDLASRNQDEWFDSIKRNFPKDWQQLEKESELVRLVHDSDGDGKADKSSVYADGFDSALDGIASGVLWHNDALYFANIPALWKLTGAEKAEQGETLHHGYGVRFSYTGHDFHGLIAGPDGRLYFSIGDRGASIKTKEGTSIEVPDEGAVFRCEPDGSQLELVMRGLRNPQELAFDDYGNLFTGDNDSDQGDRERWVAVIEGADAGWRVGYQHHLLGKEFNPWIAEAMWEPRAKAESGERKAESMGAQPQYILSPIANLPDGPSGLVHYPGTGLPAEYNGSFFLAGYKGSTAKSQISTFKCEPDGAGFKLVGLRTFMDNVQATDVDFGPDSRFYVSAWDEGWERSDQGRIYRLSHDAARNEQAAQIAEVQKILGEGFKKRTPEELVKLLAHGDQRVRLGAQWELAERKGAEDLFAKVAKDGSDGPRKNLSRLHAVWGLNHVRRLDYLHRTPPKFLGPDAEDLALLKDADPLIRANVLKGLGEHWMKFELPTEKAVIAALDDPDRRVRYEASIVLGKKAGVSGMLYLASVVTKDGSRDKYLHHAAVMGIAGIVMRDPASSLVLETIGNNPSPEIRLMGLLAARRLAEQRGLTRDAAKVNYSVDIITPAAAPKLVAIHDPHIKSPDSIVAEYLGHSDPSLVREAAIAINDASIDSATPALAALAFQQKPGGGAPSQVTVMDTSDPMLAVRVLNANFRTGGNDGANRLALFAARASHESLRVVALTMLKTWAKPPQRDYITGNPRPLAARPAADAAHQLELVAAQLLGDKSEKVLNATCEALAANDVKAAAPHLRTLAENAAAPVKSRIAALDALAKLAAPELDVALAAAGNDANPALKTAASRHLGKRNPDVAAKQLIAAWASADATQKQDIASALGGNPSKQAAEHLAKLVAALAKEPRETQLEILEAARAHTDQTDLKRALAAYEAALPAADPQAKFRVALAGGNAATGEKLFKEHPVAACLRCHKVNFSGGDAGPDLTGFADTHDREYMLESIVNVNAKIAPGFQMVILTMKDGSVKAGALKSEENGVLTLQNPGAPAEQVKAADVAKRENAPSGMIPGLGDLLTLRELRDIVEYMATLKKPQ